MKRKFLFLFFSLFTTLCSKERLSYETLLLKKISSHAEEAELVDGSIWKLSPQGRYKMFNWLPGDEIHITQNMQMLTQYKYLLCNNNTGTSFHVKPYLPPVESSEYTFTIKKINYAKGRIVLQDNSEWKLSMSDKKIFTSWTQGETIVIGVTSKWLTWYPYILINPLRNEDIHADLTYAPLGEYR